MERHPDRGEHHQLKEDAKEKRNKTHQQGDRDHGFTGKLCPFAESVT